MDRIWTPRIVVRPLLPPEPSFGARLEAQHMHWQLGHYVEDLSFGPGGQGRRKRWVVDQEAEQHNLVLNQTYDTLIAQYGFVDLNRYAVVGTGSTLPDATQTGLVAEVARTTRDQNGNTENTFSVTRVADGVYDIQRIREFTEAEVGNKNLTEWGFSPVGTYGGNLMSRELFRDGNGNPITITPASDQRLRLIYKIRVTLSPVTPVAVSINIANIGVRTGLFVLNRATGPDLNWYSESADLGLAHYFAIGWGTVYNWPLRVSIPADYTTGNDHFGQSWVTPSQSYVWSFQSYVANSRERKTNPITYLPSDFNDTIRGFALFMPTTNSSSAAARFILDPGQEFTKTNLYKLTIGEWTITWGP